MTTDWVVLLIGGTSAVGKTNAAKRIAMVSGATLLHADDIRLALGIDVPDETELAVETIKRVAATVSAALENVVAHHLETMDKIVIEGVWLTPAFAARASYGGRSASGRRAVFVVEDARERPEPISPGQSAHARWLAGETRRQGLPTVDARPVGHLAERILAVI